MTFSNLYEVQVLVKNRPVFEYHYEGDIFIEGRSGSAFTIKLNNKSYKRVKAVVSIDGLSVIDGGIASEDGDGYIIEPYSTINIDGWRISNYDVREFTFGNKKSSYSNKTGNGTTNIGVIGVIIKQEATVHQTTYYNNFFDDHRPPLWGSSVMRSSSATSNSFQSLSQSSVNNIGTGMGGVKASRVSTTTFNEDKGIPPHKFIIYYDDRKGLESRGIVVKPSHYKPDPFPASNSYCKQV